MQAPGSRASAFLPSHRRRVLAYNQYAAGSDDISKIFNSNSNNTIPVDISPVSSRIGVMLVGPWPFLVRLGRHDQLPRRGPELQPARLTMPRAPNSGSCQGRRGGAGLFDQVLNQEVFHDAYNMNRWILAALLLGAAPLLRAANEFRLTDSPSIAVHHRDLQCGQAEQ